MQCPKCHYEPTMAEMQRSPNDCVKCGINYEVHARHLAGIAAEKAAEEAAIDARAKEIALERRMATAKLAPGVRRAVEGLEGSQPVVVVDINMGFFSMVKFMVKFAIAAIPAALILMFLAYVVIPGFLGAIR